MSAALERHFESLFYSPGIIVLPSGE